MSRALKDYNSVDWNDLFYFDSNSPTGLSWKVDRMAGRWMTIYAAKKGEFAGNIHFDKKKNTKYATVPHAGTNWFAHRVIWIMKNGYLDAEKVIDHIDCNSLNNDIHNLRVVEQELNVKNSPKRKDNNTGESGVHFTIAKGRKVDSYTYVTATWYPENNKRVSKHFSVTSMGLMPAFKDAVEYRRKMIEELNAQGAGYTENHGK